MVEFDPRIEEWLRDREVLDRLDASARDAFDELESAGSDIGDVWPTLDESDQESIISAGEEPCEIDFEAWFKDEFRHNIAYDGQTEKIDVFVPEAFGGALLSDDSNGGEGDKDAARRAVSTWGLLPDADLEDIYQRMLAEAADAVHDPDFHSRTFKCDDLYRRLRAIRDQCCNEAKKIREEEEEIAQLTEAGVPREWAELRVRGDSAVPRGERR